MDRGKVKIELHLNRDFFIPGEVLRGRLHLTVSRSVHVTAVRLRVIGKEKALRRNTVLEEFTHLQQVFTFFGVKESDKTKGKRSESTKLLAGDHDFPFHMTLPPTIPPSLYTPVRRMKTKIYYFVEANIVMPSGFNGRKRQFITVFPAAQRRQWDYAHQVPFGLTGFSPEQLSGANATAPPYPVPTDAGAAASLTSGVVVVSSAASTSAPRHAAPSTAATGVSDEMEAEKERIKRESEEARLRSAAGSGSEGGGVTMGVPILPRATSSMATTTATATATATAATARTAATAGGRSGQRSATACPMTLDEAVRLPVRGGRVSGRDAGCLELSVKVLPFVMALSTRTMFPIVAAANAATNSRVNRDTYEIESDNDNDGNDDDDDDDGNDENGSSNKYPNESDNGSDPWRYPSDGSSTHGDGDGKGRKDQGEGKQRNDPARYPSAPVDDSDATSDEGEVRSHDTASEPRTVCAPSGGTAAAPLADDPAALRQRQFYEEKLNDDGAAGQRSADGSSTNGNGFHGADALRVPSVVRPTAAAAAVPSLPAPAAFSLAPNAAGGRRPGEYVDNMKGLGGNASFGGCTLSTYDDCRCLVRLTLHNGTAKKKVRGFAVTLLQFLRFDVASYHANRTLKLAEHRYVPPHGPLRPGQTITVDIPLDLPGMLRLNGVMNKRLPVPTLRTRSLEVTNVLTVTFKGGLRLEHQFSRSECISFVSAVDESNAVPPAPAVFTQSHVFPEVLVDGQVY